MWFRVLLAIVSAMLLAAAIWMGTYVSIVPSVLGRWSTQYAILLCVLLASSGVSALLAGPMYRLIHGWRHNAVLLALATAFSLGVAELAVRWFDAFGISYYADLAAYHRAKVPDPELYYVQKVGSSAEYRNFGVRINSLGMRGREVGDKAPGETRILFLGDSVTFGWGVAEPDIFVEMAEPLLQRRLGGPVRTLNSGVVGYNTQNQWAFLKRHGERLAPDAVALLYVRNDIDPTPDDAFDPMDGTRVSEMSPPETVVWVLGKSWVYRTFSHFGHHGGSWSVAAPTDALKEPGWRQSAEALSHIARWCDARDIPFVVYLVRMAVDPFSGDAVLLALRDVGTEHGFTVIDTLPWFEGQDARALTNSIVDSHPNAAGHAILAKGVSASIQAELVPP